MSYLDTALFILGASSFANLIAWGFAPLQWLKAKLKLNKSKYQYLYCSMCIGFWVAFSTLHLLSGGSNLISYIFTCSIVSIFSGYIEMNLPNGLVLED